MPAAAPCDACGQPGVTAGGGCALCPACVEAALWELASHHAAKPQGEPTWPGLRP